MLARAPAADTARANGYRLRWTVGREEGFGMGSGTSKVLVAFGTRPEAIKMAPVVAALKAMPDRFETVVAVTAQHREMLDQVTALFGIEPDHDLSIMTHGQTLAQVLTRSVEGLDRVLELERPQACLVQGDTTTTFAAAIASFYRTVPVGHVEAGLRSFDPHHPFPEEVNRRLTSVCADWHFAPTQLAAKRLADEGVPPDRIHVTGNTVIDALLEVSAREHEFAPGAVRDAVDSGRRIVLVTLHRRENWGAPARLVEAFDDIHVLFATHANPLVRERVDRALSNTPRIDLLDPLDYLPFAKLMAAATLILSDSGGIQEEAPSLGTPVLVMRDVTERPEALEAGTVALVGTDTDRIVTRASALLEDPDAYAAMARSANPFGDGTAARQIAEILDRVVDRT
jgi:UDP-N-acetylglucosamine 2-epimerase